MTRIWIVVAMVALASSVASAQATPKKPPPPCRKTAKQPCDQIIDINDPLSLNGRVRSLSLLGFLERASEELERASLEKKSFVPKLIQTVDEAAL
jgi:hypothetical protein